MRFTKPEWVMHKDSAMRGDTNEKRVSMFSCHVHPDGSRIATGGLDAKVRIWSTRPILSSAAEASGRPAKSLCTLTMHTGPVLVVRWAHSGRWLASGSDDEIVMIWDLDPNAKGKVWGSDEVNVEGWKPLKRLVGHESDVTDVAWSPGDRYLASVGLDSAVFVWCGFTLERLRKIDQHQGFVKGVCWDPVGEFLATGSDDRSVRIWRTTDWELEAEVKKPFDHSPGTFFRRLSWSPDGAHITASNATNNDGYVFIAAVISRNSWTSEISLVGHENTIEVAAYNPHIFLRDPSQPIAAHNICSVVALGADDRAVSVWQTKAPRPLVVAKDVFERQIMDLSWSKDGLTLYAVSSDGTMAVFNFDVDELEGISPQSAQDQYLKRFGFVAPPLPEGFSHQGPEEPTRASINRITPPPSPRGHTQDFGVASTPGPTGEHINTLVAKRKPKKRLQPIPASSVPSSSLNGILSSRAAARFPNASQVQINVPSTSALPLAVSQPFGSASGFGLGLSTGAGDDFAMDVDEGEVRISSLDTTAQSGRGKRRAGDDFDERGSTIKPRTLGGDRVRESVAARPLASRAPVSSASMSGGAGWAEGSSLAGLLVPPQLVTYLKAGIEGSDDIVEGRNSEEDEPNEVLYVSGKQTQWLDYVQSPILALTATASFCAAAMQDGSVNVYSHTGRRIMPSLSLGSQCYALSGAKNMLMALTASGMLYVWDVKKQAAKFPPTSISPILASPNSTILSAAVRPNGTPVLQLGDGLAHSYDALLCAWTKLAEPWWAEGSDAWQGRSRSSAAAAARGPLTTLESAIAERVSPDDGRAEKVRPTWWGAAMTLGHLESKLHAARALESPQEYKQALLLYAKRIADEGFRGKAEELVKELFGPVYWRPGRDDSWCPTVAGTPKRDLLKEVLTIFVRSKTLAKLGLDWQDILKRSLQQDD
ncbi:WD40 repeat-like protein [Epithele typhae]|uniref:WD40 repeat-like protein n=1 Tax=Epithele typhae TaxID=378194 RepID=UPI00200762A2|nr:WD40 repeat-like protein [Epithele typhae]KAH9941116.1 WD40 repeat-like protein [Epithele typhae]